MRTHSTSNDKDSLRERLVRAVAERIWRERGGNEVLNWLEAEAIMDTVAHVRRAPASAGGLLMVASPTRIIATHV